MGLVLVAGWPQVIVVVICQDAEEFLRLPQHNSNHIVPSRHAVSIAPHSHAGLEASPTSVCR